MHKAGTGLHGRHPQAVRSGISGADACCTLCRAGRGFPNAVSEIRWRRPPPHAPCGLQAFLCAARNVPGRRVWNVLVMVQVMGCYWDHLRETEVGWQWRFAPQYSHALQMGALSESIVLHYISASRYPARSITQDVWALCH